MTSPDAYSERCTSSSDALQQRSNAIREAAAGDAHAARSASKRTRHRAQPARPGPMAAPYRRPALDRDSAGIAALHDAPANGSASPLYNAEVHTSEPRATLVPTGL